MINNIRKYQKIVLGIFTVCCIMFVGEFFIKSFLFGKPTEKKYVSIKDYITKDEYIEQIMKFKRDKQLTNEFIKRFVIHYSNINIYVVDSE